MIMHLLLEGYLEESVARRLLAASGHRPGIVYGRKGCGYIRTKAARFRSLAAGNSGVLVLTDFRDAEAPCVRAALDKYLGDMAPNPPRSFLCRFAVAELESWLLADRPGLAGFLGVAAARMPEQPDLEPFPKKTLVNVARASRKADIRSAIVPSSGRKAVTAPGYTRALSGFVDQAWNIDRAVRRSPSLERCLRRLGELR
jgi:hypothetical protein